MQLVHNDGAHHEKGAGSGSISKYYQQHLIPRSVFNFINRLRSALGGDSYEELGLFFAQEREKASCVASSKKNAWRWAGKGSVPRGCGYCQRCEWQARLPFMSHEEVSDEIARQDLDESTPKGKGTDRHSFSSPATGPAVDKKGRSSAVKLEESSTAGRWQKH